MVLLLLFSVLLRILALIAGEWRSRETDVRSSGFAWGLL